MSRQVTSLRGIVLIAVAAVLAACTPPMPPDVLAARAESQIVCQPGEVQVSVADGFVGSMSAVGAALSGVCPDETVLEVLPTDPAPVALVDSVPTAATISDFSTERCEGAPAIAVPAFAYPVTIAYNVPGLEGLVMTPEAVAGILSGTVTSFEDPLIAGANPDFDLTGLPPVTLLAVESPQGAVEAMTTWLTAEAPQAWTAGVTGTLPAARQLPAQVDLIGELAVTEASIAVLPIFDALNNVLAMANLPVKGTDANGNAFDTVVTTDDVQLYKVGSGATTAQPGEDGTSLLVPPAVGGIPVPGSFDLASSKIVLGEDQPLVGWPVLGYAHIIVCDSPSDPLPLSFAQYLVRLAGQGSLETFGLTPLPEPFRVQSFIPLKVKVSTEEPSAGATDSGVSDSLAPVPSAS